MSCAAIEIQYITGLGQIVESEPDEDVLAIIASSSSDVLPATAFCYEDYFNSTWFLDEAFTKQIFQYGSISVELSGLPWEVVQSGAGYSRIGHTLWAAGDMLARYLAEHPSLVKGRRVLELGCGLGLTGLTAAHLSDDPSSVYLTDGDASILDALQLNVDNNFPSDRQPHCDVLYWGSETSRDFVTDHGRFQLILGADVLYTESSLEPLTSTVALLLDDSASRAAMMLVAFQTKYGGRFRERFLELAGERGLLARRLEWGNAGVEKARLLEGEGCEGGAKREGVAAECCVELWEFLWKPIGIKKLVM